MVTLYLVTAGVFALAGLVVWLVFLRPVPRLVDGGTVIEKQYRESATYWQVQSGISRGFRTPTAIEIAEAYVLEIELDGVAGRVSHALSVAASRDIEEGDRVIAIALPEAIPAVEKLFS